MHIYITSNGKSNFPIIYHSLELKMRLMYTLLCIFITFCTSYFYSEQLCMLLASPLIKLSTGSTNIHFIYTNLTEAFFSYLKISFFISLLFVFPFILFQIWMFLVPGLYYNEKKKILFLISIFILLILFGTIMAYFFIIPIAWKFFLSFEIESQTFLSINLQPKMDQYLSLILNILITLGLSFHLPIYLYFILKSNIVSYEWIVLKRNISLVIVFILAAIISPPDIISQIFIAIPLFILYEFVVFLIILNKEYEFFIK